MADKGCCSIAETPRGQDQKNYDADSDGVAGKSRRAKNADDANQSNPTGMGDEELENSGKRNADQAQQDGNVQANMLAQNSDMF